MDVTETYTVSDIINSSDDMLTYQRNILNYMYNKDKEIDIIMKEGRTDDIFKIVVTDSILLVILRDGFSNFKNVNVSDFNYWFNSILIDYMLKSFKEKDVVNSVMFKMFTRQIMKG
jgi:hypothetical protein